MLGLAGGLVALKAVTLTALGKLLKLSTPTALRTKVPYVTQRGFRPFRICVDAVFDASRRRRSAREESGFISTGQNRVLLTTVAMSMAATPFVAQLGDTIAKSQASPVADNSTADLDRFGMLC